MKTRDIEGILRNKGYELGTMYILQAQNERIVRLDRGLAELAQSLEILADMMVNVVHGAAATRDQVKHKMRSLGIELEDDLPPNTHALGDK